MATIAAMAAMAPWRRRAAESAIKDAMAARSIDRARRAQAEAAEAIRAAFARAAEPTRERVAR